MKEQLKKLKPSVIKKCMQDVDADKKELYRAACYDVFKFLEKEVSALEADGGDDG